MHNTLLCIQTDSMHNMLALYRPPAIRLSLNIYVHFIFLHTFTYSHSYLLYFYISVYKGSLCFCLCFLWFLSLIQFVLSFRSFLSFCFCLSFRQLAVSVSVSRYVSPYFFPFSFLSYLFLSSCLPHFFVISASPFPSVVRLLNCQSLSVCVSAFLSFCLSVCLFVSLCVSLFVLLFVCLLVCQSVLMLVNPSASLSVSLSDGLPICSVCLCVCLPECLSSSSPHLSTPLLLVYLVYRGISHLVNKARFLSCNYCFSWWLGGGEWRPGLSWNPESHPGKQPVIPPLQAVNQTHHGHHPDGQGSLPWHANDSHPNTK